MSRYEPGTLDMYGASWTSDAEYKMLPDAKRYEQYEKYFAGVVCIFLPVPLAIPFFTSVHSSHHKVFPSQET